MPYRGEGANQDMVVEDLETRDDLTVGDDLIVGWDFALTGALTITGTWTPTGKLVGRIYSNPTGYTDKILKIHNHDSTSNMNCEFKYESVNTSGAQYGLYNEARINATGTSSITASLNAAVVETGKTVTGGTIIGCYWQARADGTVAWNSFVVGLYGIIEASTAITANHVCSLRLDTHQANTITGSYQLLYGTENGAEALDQVMYFRTPWATAFIEFDTCSAFVSTWAETGGTAKKIRVTIDGVGYYINTYPE